MYEENVGSEVRRSESEEQPNYRRRMEIFESHARQKRSAIEEEIHRDIFWDSHTAGEYAQRCKKMRIEPDMPLWYQVNP